jgi:hypothetical protein
MPEAFQLQSLPIFACCLMLDYWHFVVRPATLAQ